MNTRPLLITLRNWRLAKGYSQRELADLAGMSKTTIVNIENGHHHPNFVTIGKLAHALGISRERLLASGQSSRRTAL